jgi:hypothetical protein
MPQPFRRELSAWRVMRRRCLDPQHKDFRRYGGKGIKVCPQRLNNFAIFLKDMGPAPTQTHWLGRLDVTKGYFPENCVWTTRAEQMPRQRWCKKVVQHGKAMPAVVLARRMSVNKNTLLRRSAKGLPPEFRGRLSQATKFLTHQGETLPLPEWARRIGLSVNVLSMRIRKGVSVERAFQPGRLKRQSARPPETGLLDSMPPSKRVS